MSGLPVNTFSQAAEYRKRYLATLALEAQNDAYNLQANQVYKQTGQISQLPDTRSTTEKLADFERLRVDLRNGLKTIADNASIDLAFRELTNDEIVFAVQQLPAIVADLKPKFALGVPGPVLVSYIRALRRKFLETSGVSFSAQDATAQQILNAIQAGVNMLGANGGPFAIAGGAPPPGPPPGGAPQPPPGPGPGPAPGPAPGALEDMFQRRRPPPASTLTPEQEARMADEAEMKQAEESAKARREEAILKQAEEWLARGTTPYSSLPKNVQDKVNQIKSSKMSSSTTEQASVADVINFKADDKMKQGAREFGPTSMEQWDAFPTAGGFKPYPNSEAIAIQYLKWWAGSQDLEIQAAFDTGYEKKNKLSTLKKALLPGVIEKLSLTAPAGTTESDPFIPPIVAPFIPPIVAPSGVVDFTDGLTPAARTSRRTDYLFDDARTSSGVADVFGEMSGARGEEESRRISSSSMLLEKIGNPKFSQKELVRDITAFLKENGKLDELVDISSGEIITPNEINLNGKTSIKLEPYETNLIELVQQIRGKGIKPKPPSKYKTLPYPTYREQEPEGRYHILPYPTMGEGVAPKYRTLPVRRPNAPASRYPVGREILGYGLKLPEKPKKVKTIQLDMSKGLAYESSPTYIPFGKYAINPSKLSSGIFEMKTLKGGGVKKYPIRKLSSSLTKVVNRIISGRGIDDYDFNEMDLEDQHFLYDLTNDAKINDRIQLPTPKRSKDGEEENRFEILKGQISAGNDNKDLVKEFKRMLVKFSDDGRIKKAEAREILLDLTAMGY
jgi:hypothetical protein